MSALIRRTLALPHGVTLECLASGVAAATESARRVMLLHGFPEAAFIWEPVMTELGPQVQCLAPNLRGFAGSSTPPDIAAYRARHLVADISAAIEATGAPVDVLVAHDWGGALAWGLAALRPDLLRHLLIINSPHPATFLRELLFNPAQQAASAYMTFLCRPDAQALLSENDFARLWPFFGQAAWLTPALKQRYREVWSRGLDGALNYYRSSPLRPPQGPDDALHALQLPPSTTQVSVPTTVLWGERDKALLPGLLNGLDAHVPQLRVVRVPEASHWLVHEQPQRVVQEIRRAMGS